MLSWYINIHVQVGAHSVPMPDTETFYLTEPLSETTSFSEQFCLTEIFYSRDMLLLFLFNSNLNAFNSALFEILG